MRYFDRKIEDIKRKKLEIVFYEDQVKKSSTNPS